MIKHLDSKENEFILSRNYIGYLAYNYLNKPFVLPITYYYNSEKNNIICYSGKGHKIDALRKNNTVSMCVTDITAINDWKSIMVHGNYKEQSGSESLALLHQFSLGIKDLIIKNENKSLDYISQFSSKINSEDLPIIYTIEIESISGKMRKF